MAGFKGVQQVAVAYIRKAPGFDKIPTQGGNHCGVFGKSQTLTFQLGLRHIEHGIISSGDGESGKSALQK